MVSYELPRLVATAEWLRGTMRPPPLTADRDFSGFSVFAELREGLQGWAAFGRLEGFDPDIQVPDNSRQRAIAGVAYWLTWSAVRLGFVVNAENVRYDAGAAERNENRLLVQTHIQF